MTQQCNVQPWSITTRFLRNFDGYLGLYGELESAEREAMSKHLFSLGREIKAGKKSWTEAELYSIVRWRRLHPLWKRIKEDPMDLEMRLNGALSEKDLGNRVDAICRIPGFGPVLACAILTLTWPETYGALDNPSWRALGLLGFDLPERPYSGGGFSVADAVHYQTIIRALGSIENRMPVEVANALHAFGKTRQDAELSSSELRLRKSPRLVIENRKKHTGAWSS